MRYIILFSFLVFAVSSANCQDGNTQKFYVGTYTSEGAEGIYLCDFNYESGEISLNKIFKGVNNPSFLKISPDRKYLYSISEIADAIEKSGGFVVAYKIGKNGTLHFLNKQISNGANPCHIDVSPDGDFAAIATYTGGTTSVYPIDENGILLPASSVIYNNETRNVNNKVVSHAHSIKFSPFDGKVYSADLGTDQLNIFSLEIGELSPYKQNFVKMKQGAGPRHFEFGSNGKIIYVINELNSTISVLKMESGVWTNIQNISTLPAKFDGKSYCADIHISANGKYLYGSNRGHNSIAVFDVNPESSELVFKGTVSVEGDWPRNFTLSPNGKFMLVANQRSGNITVFRINTETGMPEFTGKEIKLPAPVCLEFL